MVERDDGEFSKDLLFCTPTCVSAKISPNSKTIAYVGADESGIPNVFIRAPEEIETTQISFFTTPEIIQFFWAPDSSKVLLLKDEDGTGQLHLYGVDIHSKESVDYTKDLTVSAKLIQISTTQNKAAIGLNDRDPYFHDLYLLDLDSGERSLLLKNEEFAKFLVSDSLEIILKMRINEDGSWTVVTSRDDLFMQLSAEEAFQTEFLSYNEKKKTVYLLDNRFSDINQLVEKPLHSDDEKVLGSQPKSDVDDVLFIDGEPKAYASYYEQKKWHVLDRSIEKDISFLEERCGSGFEIINQSKKGDFWIVANSLPDKGSTRFVFDRKAQKLFEVSPSTPKSDLSKMYSMVVKSRDGLDLVSYYTLPKEFDKGGYVEKPLPLVVVPHGGPFKVRDKFEFASFHQWLASCGYAVLSVNFRLSSGFGKAFVNAGNGQWGGKAHLDLIDGVEECIKRGITEKGKVGIFGASYGGYASLAALTFTPDYFSCCVSICGPSNLKTVVNNVPQFWEFTTKPLSDKNMFFTKRAFLISMGGDPDNEEGRAYLEKCSPLNHLENIKVPLLLVHGKNDHIVAEAESRQIYESMKKNDKKVTYMLFPDEGHRFAKFPNKMAQIDAAERFLSEHLGGRYQGVDRKILAKSSAIISD